MLRSLLFALVLLGGCGRGDEASEPFAPAPLTGARAVLLGDAVIDIAHAGGKGLRPENTMAAFEHALASGAHVLELDVHRTADGVLVVLHDETVDRTTEGSGLVKNMSFAELQELDAGYWYSEDGGQSFPFRGVGMRVPSLEEVLAAHPEVPFVIEIKQADPPIVDDFVALCRDRGAVEHIAGASFDDDVIRALRLAAPEMLTSLALGEAFELVTLTPDEEAGYRPPGEFLQAPTEQEGISVLDQELIDTAHRVGLFVHVWTVNDASQMQSLLGMGVDGIITDYPDVLAALLAQQDG